MSDKTTGARSSLREAHAARTAATEALAAACEAADRGKLLLDSAEAELRDHQAAATAADDDAAARLAERIRDGEAPAAVVDLRDDEPAIALIGAQRRHATAKAAAGALAADVTSAEAALRVAEASVERAAVGVIAAEADAMLAELRPTITAARDLELRFRGLERALTAMMPEISAPLAPVVRAARSVLERPDTFRTSIPMYDPESVATRRTVAYAAALRTDPDATFDDIADPQARQPAQAAE